MICLILLCIRVSRGMYGSTESTDAPSANSSQHLIAHLNHESQVAVDIFSEVSGFIPIDRNPLFLVSQFTNIAARNYALWHRTWIQHNFAALLNKTNVTVNDLLSLPTVTTNNINQIEYSAIQQLQSYSIENRNDNQPLIWKGCELETQRSFLIFILHRRNVYIVNWASICASCTGNVCDVEFAVVVFDNDINSNDYVSLTIHQIQLKIKRCTLMNPFCKASFGERNDKSKYNVSFEKISDVIKNRRLIIEPVTWMIDTNWDDFLVKVSEVRDDMRMRKFLATFVASLFTLVLSVRNFDDRDIQDFYIVLFLFVLAVIFACW